MSRTLKIIIAVPVLLIAAVYGGSYVYVNFIQDDPPAKLTVDSTTNEEGDTTTTAGSVTDDGTTDGVWTVSADDSQVGYRVPEKLRGASTEGVGRTSEVEGSIEIAGTTVNTATFTVQTDSIVSDENFRDGKYRDALDTSTIPTATFKLTSPITLSSVDKDKELTAKATGDLTLHGVTKKVTFDLTAKRVTGQIRVSGSIPVKFADYEIDPPTSPIASVGDDGTLEFTLVFTR